MSFDDDLLLWILAGVLGLAVFAIAFALGGDESGSKRVQKVRNRARGTGNEERAAEMILRRDPKRNRGFEGMMRRLLPHPELLRQRLMRTGWSIGLGGFAIACGIAVVVCSGSLFLMHLPLAMAVPGGIILGLLLPHMVVGFAVSRRANRFTKQFPEAIGLMVRGIKSGLPIAETFVIVGQEVPDPVGEEFRRVSDEVRLGQPMEQALWDSAKRVGTAEVKFLVVSLSVQKETGGNLAETLENLDTILRRRRQMKLKIRAMSSEARASAAIIGALPFIMLGVLAGLNPEYIGKLFETSLGHMMLGGGGFSMALGVFIMQKMARFEI